MKNDIPEFGSTPRFSQTHRTFPANSLFGLLGTSPLRISESLDDDEQDIFGPLFPRERIAERKKRTQLDDIPEFGSGKRFTSI